jgi:ribose transport system ATP-binding protein
MRTIFGAERTDAGTILLDGAPLPPSSTEVAVRRGVAYIPAERTTEAALMEMDVAQNITISHLESVTDGPLIRQQSEHRLARDWIDRLAIRPPAVGALMSTLSGGNQQKVIFARWLLSPETRLLLLDHPTRGLDVGAKAEVYGIIRECAAAGTAILLISDSLEETIALSHRLIVMKDGMVTGNLEAPPGSKPDQLDVLERML